MDSNLEKSGANEREGGKNTLAKGKHLIEQYKQALHQRLLLNQSGIEQILSTQIKPHIR